MDIGILFILFLLVLGAAGWIRFLIGVGKTETGREARGALLRWILKK